ncbi:MAG: 2OG-Fe(II) oxygenase, partial [Gammaproteobacteria bacterium]|nr:2OG-Fe(II) oxygenase [Gammaproteobacteria bacterium]
VLNLTPVWKNHWGGALVFPGAEDQESSLMLVKFNALNIFSVPQKHYVSYVAPFAGEHRYSITGWFRS